MLEVSQLKAGYGAIEALHGISFDVRPGEIVTLIGANGAGKSTTLRAISGLVRARSGDIRFEGRSVVGMAPHEIVGMGLAHVPEGRMVFPNLTVMENLRMGAYLQRDTAVVAGVLEEVFEMFPRLRERERQLAGTLSGGEQQMLAIGRALMGRPRFLMLDEPSLGIAPLLVKSIFEQVVRINRDRGLAILLVEQNANLALRVSQRGHVLETGRIALSAEASSLLADPAVRKAYLGGH
jgi:branched-chain amino acid transport system ATP-binding protein